MCGGGVNRLSLHAAKSFNFFTEFSAGAPLQQKEANDAFGFEVDASCADDFIFQVRFLQVYRTPVNFPCPR